MTAEVSAAILDAERQLVGAALWADDDYTFEMLEPFLDTIRPEHFSDTLHRDAWGAILSLINRDAPAIAPGIVVLEMRRLHRTVTTNTVPRLEALRDGFTAPGFIAGFVARLLGTP